LRPYIGINSGAPSPQSAWRTNDYVEFTVVYEVAP